MPPPPLVCLQAAMWSGLGGLEREFLSKLLSIKVVRTLTRPMGRASPP